jgi:hypothetical protein
MRQGLRRDLFVAILGFAFGSLVIVANAGNLVSEDRVVDTTILKPA